MKKPVLILLVLIFALIFSGSASAVTTITNGIYTVHVDDTSNNIGCYSVDTGTSNPTPDTSILYGDAFEITSYLTVRDENCQTDYTSSSNSISSPGYTQADLDGYNPVVNQVSTNHVDTTWNVTALGGGPLFDVLQRIIITGTTVDDSRVNIITAVFNRRSTTSIFSIRYLWDLDIANNPGPQVATVSPDGAWQTNEITWASPMFMSWIATDNPTTPTLTVQGSVSGQSQPNILIFADSEATHPASCCYRAYDYTPSSLEVTNPPGTDHNNAILYYWEHITLAAGENLVVNAYINATSGGTSLTTGNQGSTSTNNNVVAASTNINTIGMQNTGIPIVGIVLAVLLMFAGLIIPRRK